MGRERLAGRAGAQGRRMFKPRTLSLLLLLPLACQTAAPEGTASDEATGAQPVVGPQGRASTIRMSPSWAAPPRGTPPPASASGCRWRGKAAPAVVRRLGEAALARGAHPDDRGPGGAARQAGGRCPALRGGARRSGPAARAGRVPGRRRGHCGPRRDPAQADPDRGRAAADGARCRRGAAGEVR